jgi:hypothetical protein
VVTATKKITLQVGGSFIVISPAGVFSSGPIVADNSGGSPDPPGGVTLVEPVADPKQADDGTT